MRVAFAADEVVGVETAALCAEDGAVAAVAILLGAGADGTLDVGVYADCGEEGDEEKGGGLGVHCCCWLGGMGNRSTGWK